MDSGFEHLLLYGSAIALIAVSGKSMIVIMLYRMAKESLRFFLTKLSGEDIIISESKEATNGSRRDVVE